MCRYGWGGHQGVFSSSEPGPISVPDNSQHVVADVTRISNEAGFTLVRDGYDPVEVEEQLAELQTQLAVATIRSAALERVLRATVAEATELLERLDSEIGVPTGRDPRLDQGRQSQRPDRVEITEPTNTRDAVAAAPAVALDTAQSAPDRAASNAASQAMDVTEPTTSSERQWIRGTIRTIVETDAGLTIWVVPEDQPQTAVSVSFTEDDVGREAVAYVRANFGAGDQARIWHVEHHGQDIEPV